MPADSPAPSDLDQDHPFPVFDSARERAERAVAAVAGFAEDASGTWQAKAAEAVAAADAAVAALVDAVHTLYEEQVSEEHRAAVQHGVQRVVQRLGEVAGAASGRVGEFAAGAAGRLQAVADQAAPVVVNTEREAMRRLAAAMHTLGAELKGLQEKGGGATRSAVGRAVAECEHLARAVEAKALPPARRARLDAYFSSVRNYLHATTDAVSAQAHVLAALVSQRVASLLGTVEDDDAPKDDLDSTESLEGTPAEKRMAEATAFEDGTPSPPPAAPCHSAQSFVKALPLSRSDEREMSTRSQEGSPVHMEDVMATPCNDVDAASHVAAAWTPATLPSTHAEGELPVTPVAANPPDQAAPEDQGESAVARTIHRVVDAEQAVQHVVTDALRATAAAVGHFVEEARASVEAAGSASPIVPEVGIGTGVADLVHDDSIAAHARDGSEEPIDILEHKVEGAICSVVSAAADVERDSGPILGDVGMGDDVAEITHEQSVRAHARDGSEEPIDTLEHKAGEVLHAVVDTVVAAEHRVMDALAGAAHAIADAAVKSEEVAEKILLGAPRDFGDDDDEEGDEGELRVVHGGDSTLHHRSTSAP